MLITCLEDLKEGLFNHSNCSYSSLEVAVYLFLSLKGRQSFIVWCVLCCFHWLYHCCHSLSLIANCCHSFSLVVLLIVTLCHLLHHSLSSLSFVVTCCHSLYLSLSFVVPLVVTRCDSLSLVVPLAVTCCHSLSLVVTRYTTRLSFYKRSEMKCSERNISKCILVLRTPILKNIWERLLLNELSHLRHYLFSRNIEISENSV